MTDQTPGGAPLGWNEPVPTRGAAAADARAVVRIGGARFTVMTSRLIRMEYSEDGAFVDAPTQMVVRRTMGAGVPDFEAVVEGDGLALTTEHLLLKYAGGPFTPSTLSVTLRQVDRPTCRDTWHYGDPAFSNEANFGNLGGTARTLDTVDGAIDIEPGIFSHEGYAVIDDSSTCQVTDDGWVAPRSRSATDLYFFGYGTAINAALQDYFALTGPNPLLPRQVLGNWWSRYHRYTQASYLELMDGFRAAGIPLSVAVLDMDWHLTDVDPKYGNGWTGYTWDRALFPDPEALLADLHSRGVLVTLNDHPAGGVAAHEDAYPLMARAMGIDPITEATVEFDATSRRFMEAFFEHVAHPLEDQGVDFWWIDWQSGGTSAVEGLDPLWILNHAHYLDSARRGTRPLTLSRYAGPGSQRYPVGFSGDTIVTWKSLAFQPFFTATAANIGFFWWSHDIGGHMGGYKDNELATRWLQFGVFSPILRLHSSSNPFLTKDPRDFSPELRDIMVRFLRLRHQLVPYLYSAMWTATMRGVAPVRPMYHDHPGESTAYAVPNEYMFGPDLLVAPLTTPTEARSHLARTEAWLPEGTWTDIFTGLPYAGGRKVALHRTRTSIPVLARAGAVIPLASDPMETLDHAPKALTLMVVPGEDSGTPGRADLIEDDGSAAPEPWHTEITATWGEDRVTLRVAPTGRTGELRDLTVALLGVSAVDGPHSVEGPLTMIALGEHDLSEGLDVTVSGVARDQGIRRRLAFELLDDAEIGYQAKADAMAAVDAALASPGGPAQALPALSMFGFPPNLLGALAEVATA